MNDTRDFDRAVDQWLNDGTDATPPEVIDAVLLAARSTPQEQEFRITWRTLTMRRVTYALAAVAALAVGLTALNALGPRIGIGSEPTPTERPSVDLGIFEPVAGWIVYGNGGLWGIDPSRPTGTRVQLIELTAATGTPLAWSSDGTQLLILRGSGDDKHLFVLHADGSETQVTERPMFIKTATFSADASRVVLATEPVDGAWAVYSLDVNGGPATLLASPRGPEVAEMTFSPDGTQIAYVLWGHGDGDHPVWVMNADGTDAHEIVNNATTGGPGHVYRNALAWSPAGDRIALALDGIIYTFATDGSDFTRVMSGNSPLWSPDGSRLVSRRAATWHPGADATGLSPTPPPIGAATPAPTLAQESSEFVIGSLKYAELHVPYRERWEQHYNVLVAMLTGVRLEL